MQFNYNRDETYSGIKSVIDFKNEGNLLHEVVYMCINKYLIDLGKKGKFQYLMLPKTFHNDSVPDMYICSSNTCYDTFAINAGDKHKHKITLLYIS